MDAHFRDFRPRQRSLWSILARTSSGLKNAIAEEDDRAKALRRGLKALLNG
jgi:hypothetical protein